MTFLRVNTLTHTESHCPSQQDSGKNPEPHRKKSNLGDKTSRTISASSKCIFRSECCCYRLNMVDFQAVFNKSSQNILQLLLLNSPQIDSSLTPCSWPASSPFSWAGKCAFCYWLSSVHQQHFPKWAHQCSPKESLNLWNPTPKNTVLYSADHVLWTQKFHCFTIKMKSNKKHTLDVLKGVQKQCRCNFKSLWYRYISLSTK